MKVWINKYVGDEKFIDRSDVCKWFSELCNSNKLFMWISKVDIDNIDSIEECKECWTLNMRDGSMINMGKMNVE